jgi:hypothetical protein
MFEALRKKCLVGEAGVGVLFAYPGSCHNSKQLGVSLSCWTMTSV